MKVQLNLLDVNDYCRWVKRDWLLTLRGHIHLLNPECPTEFAWLWISQQQYGVDFEMRSR
jgi:hypothetical protein